MPFKLRTTLYSVTLYLAISQIALGVTSGLLDGFSRWLFIFGPIAGAFAILTSIWISVLLAFNSRPLSTNVFSRAYVHYWSLLGIAFVSIACGIMAFTQAPAECNFERDSDGLAGAWCAVALTSGAVEFLIAILCVATAFVIRKTTPKLSNNVCSGDQKFAGIIPDVA